jgi:hypothetical protein
MEIYPWNKFRYLTCEISVWSKENNAFMLQLIQIFRSVSDIYILDLHCVNNVHECTGVTIWLLVEGSSLLLLPSLALLHTKQNQWCILFGFNYLFQVFVDIV